mmetsp:Transcript_180/g.253  ORF Transcript_180/g.253 Transcript_180/m.253 type:complete len:166 (-) Transcript_180:524-1021(-)
MYYLNANINFVAEENHKLWGHRKPSDFASLEHKSHAEKHEHQDSDFMHATATQIRTLIPILQFLTVTWAEMFLIDRKFEKLDDTFVIVQSMLGAQALLTLYLFYVPFYSNESRCLNACGAYMHTIATMLVFLVLPLVCGALSILAAIDGGLKNPRSSLHVTVMIC